MNTIKFQKGGAQVVAHRGVSGLEVENTCAAFVAAGNRSYYGVETDVHKTADGYFVVCHDSNLKRVAGENIEIEEVSLSVLQSVILIDKDGTKNRQDLRIGTLENYISICKKYEKHCVLELKTYYSDEDIAKIVEIIRGLDYLDQVTFISFGYENLVKIRALLPEQSVQFLFGEVTQEIMDQVIADKMDVDVAYKYLTKENVAAFHAAGLKVNAWTVDNPEDAETLVSWGVDYITSNILE